MAIVVNKIFISISQFTVRLFLQALQLHKIESVYISFDYIISY